MSDAFPRSYDVLDLDLPCDFGRPAETEQLLRAKLDGELPDPRRFEILSQIARVEALQGKFTNAERTLAQILKHLPQAVGASLQIRYLLELGRFHILRRTPSQARPRLLQAWTAASEAGDWFLAIDAAQMLALIEPRKERLEWLQRGLDVALSSTEPRVIRWRGALHQALGWYFLDLDMFEKALQCFERATECFRSEGEVAGSIESRAASARVLRALNKFEEAMEIQQTLLQELKRSRSENGFVYEELAECLYALKKPEQAQPYFERAHEILSKDQWLADNHAARINRLKRLAKPRS